MENKICEKPVLDFLEYLKSEKLLKNDGTIKFKSKRVGKFEVFSENDWQLKILTQYDEFLDEILAVESEEVQKFVTNQMGYQGCGRCIKGKCSCTGVSIKYFDENLLSLAKKLITLRCDAILNERVPKCNYIKISDRGTMKKCEKCKVCNPACRKLKNF